jgi:hypothetical protein
MESTLIDLHRASDAEETYAICFATDPQKAWLTERGYGQKFEKIWSVELQSEHKPETLKVDWDSVMDRVIEAYRLSDPWIGNFSWPLLQSGCA